MTRGVSREWLALLAEDIRYWMPLNRNVRFGQTDRFTRERQDVAWFDEGRETLAQRVAQLATGIHWAEEPQSRTSHLVHQSPRAAPLFPTRRTPRRSPPPRASSSTATACQDEVDILVGKRHRHAAARRILAGKSPAARSCWTRTCSWRRTSRHSSERQSRMTERKLGALRPLAFALLAASTVSFPAHAADP